MATLDSLPTEVLLNICSFLEPKEVSTLSKVNRALYAIHFEALKSIDHLGVYQLLPLDARRFISRYKNITTLDISRNFHRNARRACWRKNFAVKLASSCPKIDSFTVYGVHGLDLVKLYIISQFEKLVKKDGSSRGIKNLRVYPRNIYKCGEFLRISQRLRDVVEVSTDFNCLSIESVTLSEDDDLRSQTAECWKIVGNGIKGFSADRKWSTWLMMTILQTLHNLIRLSLLYVTVNEMDVITTNNPGLKSFTCQTLDSSGFVHIQRLMQLEYLKIGSLRESELAEVDVDEVFEAVSESLLTIDLKLNEWNGSLNAISAKCLNLRSVKLVVENIDNSDLATFRKSFGGHVDVSIKDTFGRDIWFANTLQPANNRILLRPPYQKSSFVYRSLN